jgi:hypothetical protein
MATGALRGMPPKAAAATEQINYMDAPLFPAKNTMSSQAI